MKTIFSTNAVHPRDRFDFWHSVACQNMVAHDASPTSRTTFQAELRAGKLGEIDLFLFGNSEMTVSYTARHIARADSGHLFLCRQMAGGLALDQHGREVVLAPGHFTLLDPGVPYTGRFLEGSELLVMRIPRRPLEARVGRVRDMTARSIKPTAGANALAASFIGSLPNHVNDLDPLAQEVVQNQALDLIAVALGNSIGRAEVPGSSARATALLKVRSAIDARLADPRLNAQEVALAAGVSVRYANAVLADSGSSIRRLIQVQRLDRCRRALADPLQSSRSVSDIAYGWGFSDMTHFGRKFKAAFGVVPSEYRVIHAVDVGKAGGG